MEKLKKEVRFFLIDMGVDLIGFADVSDLYEEFKTSIVFGISELKLHLLAKENQTTFLAFANDFIDNVAFQLKSFIEDRGYQAFTKYLHDETTQIKFKSQDPDFMKRYSIRFPIIEFAVRAGLGTKGRMGFLVTPKFGPKIRIMSVLTDASLAPDSQIPFSPCKNCKECLDICPLQDRNVGDRQWDFCIGCHLCIDICPASNSQENDKHDL